jgi:hypothetical protein
MEPGADPEVVIYERRNMGIEADVFRISNLPWIIIDSQESIRLNPDPVNIKLPTFIFKTINLMQAVQWLNRFTIRGNQNHRKNQEPNSHQFTRQERGVKPRPITSTEGGQDGFIDVRFGWFRNPRPHLLKSTRRGLKTSPGTP